MMWAVGGCRPYHHKHLNSTVFRGALPEIIATYLHPRRQDWYEPPPTQMLHWLREQSNCASTCCNSISILVSRRHMKWKEAVKYVNVRLLLWSPHLAVVAVAVVEGRASGGGRPAPPRSSRWGSVGGGTPEKSATPVFSRRRRRSVRASPEHPHP
jgi:hypothetical protein